LRKKARFISHEQLTRRWSFRHEEDQRIRDIDSNNNNNNRSEKS